MLSGGATVGAAVDIEEDAGATASFAAVNPTLALSCCSAFLNATLPFLEQHK